MKRVVPTGGPLCLLHSHHGSLLDHRDGPTRRDRTPAAGALPNVRSPGL